MTMTTTMRHHLFQQHQTEVLAGFAADPKWHLDAEDNADAQFSARECELIARTAPTEYLAGFWFARAMALRERSAMTGGRATE